MTLHDVRIYTDRATVRYGVAQKTTTGFNYTKLKVRGLEPDDYSELVRAVQGKSDGKTILAIEGKPSKLEELCWLLKPVEKIE